MRDPKRPAVILVIDDDPDNMDVALNCLAECDYTILVAEDGETGLARAEYAQPDLILLDVMMPGIDGLETCRRLKGTTKTSDIPVIFMTALAETEHKVNGFAAGAVDYITKPFRREEVLARVGVHLRLRELAHRLQEANETLEKKVEGRTGELAQTISALHDEIMERRQTEQELARLARAIEHAAESIFVADANWCFSYVNPAFEQMTGYHRNEVIGRSCTILRNSVEEDDTYESIRAIISHEDAWSGRLDTRRSDGSIFQAETTASAVKDAKGAVVNYVIIQRDITNELKLERELRHAQKMEAIGTLAGGIAHDFNNILTAIIGFTTLAQGRLDEDDLAFRDLERVQEASNRAKELVSRILTFCRQGEQELKPVQLSPVIEEVLLLLRSTLPATIEINKSIMTANGNDTIMADSVLLHQVLMNLATNAAHAMRDHGGVLAVSLMETDADVPLEALYPDHKSGGYIRLAVSDTGHGMEKSVRERIFDPYFTTKKVGEGTGMGLSMVQGIIKSLGGAITVDSEPGQGTTFHVFLPKATGNAVAPPWVSDTLQGGAERILFVDDEEILVALAQEQLGGFGYAITAKRCSREALEAFRAAPQAFDLVITDMTMPGLTGRDLAGELLAVRPDIPIILCTGFSELIDERQASEIGITGYIMKPYSASILNKTIRSVLASHNRRASSLGIY